ncbi:DUF7522 family protein [Halarchaeum nitratireducens]|uniref:Uncharacterized protein n=1 Tax=Halarchaeum nitratireducens TaxID=489913 RepID=A0A830G9E7_9EURY|nr:MULTISPECIES: hypothetical protein [Halarchaeum]MBP2251613.1 hypothetical protein [Halarchaeum solikamskense]GGN13697.1 hypothetical protein GCM10009021_12260 [Halarchaeum nitratireducens]
MNDRVREELRRACRSAIGDSLRSIVYFTADDYEQLYLREDLDASADLASFVENERRGFERRETGVNSELGGYEYTIHSHEDGALTRVITADHGVFVTTDPLSTARFEEVATAIREVLAQTPER